MYDKDFQLRTPLHYACYGGVDLGNPQIRIKIIDKLAGEQDNSGLTAMMVAARFGDVNSIRALFEREKSFVDKRGNTAFMYAVKHR